MKLKTQQQLNDWGWILIISTSLIIAFGSIHLLQPNPANFHPDFQEKYINSFSILLSHGISAISALLLGLLQFNSTLRTKYKTIHRIIGMIYFSSVFIAGITGFYLGLQAFGGIISQISFCLLSVLWIFTGGMALIEAISKNFSKHQAWIIRNFSLTFGAVTFRFILNGMQMAGFEFEEIYPYITWLGWVPNLIIAEIIVIRIQNFQATTLKKVLN